MANWFLNGVFYGAIGSLFLAVGIAAFRYHLLKKELRYIVALLGLGVLAEIVSYILGKLTGNNLPALHLYTILEFNIIALFYFSFFGYFYDRRLVPFLMIGFTGFAVFNSIFIQKITEFNTYARGLEALLVIVFALLCFYKMLMELNTKRPEKHPVFWINTGFLFYFAGSLTLFILSNLVLKENKAFNYLSWGLHSCLLILLHLFIGIGLWQRPRQT